MLKYDPVGESNILLLFATGTCTKSIHRRLKPRTLLSGMQKFTIFGTGADVKLYSSEKGPFPGTEARRA